MIKHKIAGQMDKYARRKPCRSLEELKKMKPAEADAYLQGYYNLSNNAHIMRLR